MVVLNVFKVVDDSLTLHFRDAADVNLDSQYPDERAFIALREYLRDAADSSLLDTTVDKIIDAFPDEAGSGYGSRDLMQVVLDLAEQIPYNHIAQTRLIDALWALRNNPKLDQKPGFTKNSKSAAADIDQTFIDMLSELFGGYEDAETYVNLNAFHARVQSSPLKLPGSWASTIMAAAFAPKSSKADDITQDAYVLGAAQWILWHGQPLYQACSSSSSSSGSSRSASRIEKPTLKDWSFWKQGFEKHLRGAKVGAECKEVCEFVAERMKEIEE